MSENVEYLSKDEEDKLEDKCKEYLYSQSSKFSSLSRTIVYSLIGVIWIVSYTETGFMLPNNTLLGALILGFIYLSVDIIHYFCDTCFYRSATSFLQENPLSKEMIEYHNKRMRKNGLRSFRWIIAKFSLLLIFVFIFFIGFIQNVL